MNPFVFDPNKVIPKPSSSFMYEQFYPNGYEYNESDSDEDYDGYYEESVEHSEGN